MEAWGENSSGERAGSAQSLAKHAVNTSLYARLRHPWLRNGFARLRALPDERFGLTLFGDFPDQGLDIDGDKLVDGRVHLAARGEWAHVDSIPD
jgi:hypothetical protein